MVSESSTALTRFSMNLRRRKAGSVRMEEAMTVPSVQVPIMSSTRMPGSIDSVDAVMLEAGLDRGLEVRSAVVK